MNRTIQGVLQEATTLGLRFIAAGSRLDVFGLEKLNDDDRADWTRVIRSWKAELLAAAKPNEDPAAPVLARFDVMVALIENDADAKVAVAQLVVEADGAPIGLDIETEPEPGQVEAAHAAAVAAEAARNREKAYKMAGDPRAMDAHLEHKQARERARFHSRAGFDPTRSRIRLVQAWGGRGEAFVFDMREVSMVTLAPLWSRRLAIHNAQFELKHLMHAGVELERAGCTMQMAGLMLGTHHRSLKAASMEMLDVDLGKELQTSDWSAAELSDAQINYAALDAVLARILFDRLDRAVTTTRSAYVIQRDCLAAVARMELAGLPLDVDAARALLISLVGELREIDVRYREACRQGGHADWASAGFSTSPPHIRKVLEQILGPIDFREWERTATGLLSVRRAELRKAAHYEIVACITEASRIERLRDYIPKLLAHAGADGRVRASYSIALARSGRSSCSDPPLQQMPAKDKRFRSIFWAPEGLVFIAADFRAMELRAAAWVSGDETMLEIFAQGIDPHKVTAGQMRDVPWELIADDAPERQAAKAINLGACYGMGAGGLVKAAWSNYGLVLDVWEAKEYLDAFALRFSGIDQWRRRNADSAKRSGVIVIGRDAIRGEGRTFQYAWNSGDDERRQYPQACNLPIQGICADAAMAALAMADAAFRQAGIRGGLVAFMHDELVAVVDTNQAELATTLLTGAMTDAFETIMPGMDHGPKGVVGAGMGPSWAATKAWPVESQPEPACS